MLLHREIDDSLDLVGLLRQRLPEIPRGGRR
jgi:hypothetical protein